MKNRKKVNGIIDSVCKTLKNKSDNDEEINKNYNELLNILSSEDNISPDHYMFDTVAKLKMLSDYNKLYVLFATWKKLIKSKMGEIWIPTKIIDLLSGIIKILPLKDKSSAMFELLQPNLIGELLFEFNNEYVDIFGSFNNKTKNYTSKIYDICNISNINFEKNLLYFLENDNQYDLTFMFPFLSKGILDSFNNEISEIRNDADIKNIKKRDITNISLRKGVDHLKDGGYMLAIVPNGFLTNNNNSSLRSTLKSNYQILSIIEMPRKGVFKQTSINTSIIILKNSDKPQNEIFLAKFEEGKFEQEKDKLLDEFKYFIKEELNNEDS